MPCDGSSRRWRAARDPRARADHRVRRAGGHALRVRPTGAEGPRAGWRADTARSCATGVPGRPGRDLRYFALVAGWRRHAPPAAAASTALLRVGPPAGRQPGLGGPARRGSAAHRGVPRRAGATLHGARREAAQAQAVPTRRAGLAARAAPPGPRAPRARAAATPGRVEAPVSAEPRAARGRMQAPAVTAHRGRRT